MSIKKLKDVKFGITTEDVNEVLRSPRGIERPKNIGKTDAARLITVRGVIGDIFSSVGLGSEYRSALVTNHLNDEDIVGEKFGAGAYDGEFKALHRAVADTFRNAGKPQLADDFSQNVPVFTETYHPVDFIATLLHGPNNRISKVASNNAYSVLEPFKDVMSTTLLEKGYGAPTSMDTLTQLFYNNVVAGGEDGPKVMSFDKMSPGQVFSLEDDIIKAVAVYLKNLADKKAAGVPLSSAEDRLASAVIAASEQLKKEGQNQVNQKIGETVLNNTSLIIGIIVALVALYLIFKK